MQLNKQLMPKVCFGRRFIRGFSLLELVVVIAVTSTLAALLLPALSSAKERSRRAVCRNNMRQFATTCYLFGSDNNDWFPNGVLRYSLPVSMMVSCETYSNLVSYAGNTGVLDCPNVSLDGTRTNTFQKGMRIGYNYLAGLDPRTMVALKGSDVKVAPLRLTDAGTNMLLADANIWNDSTKLKIAPHAESGPILANDTSANWDTGVSGGNVALLDLSVTWRPIKAMQKHDVSYDTGAASLSCFARW